MSDEQLKLEAHEYAERIWEDAVKDIASLVAIRSVEDMDHAEPGKPYGPAPFEALQKAVDIAARMGMDAHNCEGRIGYAADRHDRPHRHRARGHGLELRPL